MSVGEKIKQIRKEKGLTQKALGQLLSLSEGMVRQYELGIRKPKIETIEKIASALEISPLDLLGYDYWDMQFNPDGILENNVKNLEIIQQAYGSDAIKLLQEFDLLNDDGKAKAISDIEDLTMIPKYKK